MKIKKTISTIHFKKLENFIKIGRSKNKNIKDEELVSFISMSDVDQKINKQMIKSFKEVKKGYSYFEENDVIVAKITPCFENGKGFIAKNLKNNIGTGSTEFMVLTVNSNMDSDFLKFNINNKYFRKNGASQMIGSGGQRRIPKDYILNYKIIDIEKNQQEKIAHVLSMQEEQIERIKGLLQKLEKRNQYYAEKLLSGELRIKENPKTGQMEFYENEEWQDVVLNGEECRIPTDWYFTKIGDSILELPKSKIKAGEAKKCIKGIYPFFNCSENQTMFYDKFIHEGETLFLSTGGKASINYINGKSAYSTDVYAIQFKTINNLFAFYFIKKNMKYVEAIFKGSALKHLNKKDFKKIDILLPKDKEQTQISFFLNVLENEVNSLKKILLKEEERFQWMLDNLLSGEYEIID